MYSEAKHLFQISLVKINLNMNFLKYFFIIENNFYFV